MYELRERIGVGSFGTVYKAVKDDEIVAIKVIELDGTDDELEDIRREIELLANTRCEELVQYLGCEINQNSIWIITEFLEGGSLGDLIRTQALPEGVIAGILTQLLRALAYLHADRRVHRDVKSKNVLVGRNGRVKLADFGVATQLTDTTTKRHSLIGTPYFMAPEVIEQSRYDAKADIWSLGITVIELAQQAPPHAQLHPMKVLFVVPQAPSPSVNGTDLFKSFVAKCVRKNAIDRPTAAELLQDPFVSSADESQASQYLANLVKPPLPQKKTKSKYFRLIFAPAIGAAARHAIHNAGDNRKQAATALDVLVKTLEQIDRSLPDGRLSFELAKGLAATIHKNNDLLDDSSS